ncbi:hypothetical protein A8O14_07480 [Polynucleobacter wuianus]|uniref:Uncharacterized protein n=1 Tax=Polynucleobacter wuianus TaxID=1743168 RepID=A0A191UG42_9BURK|nr:MULTISPECIES: hypothetical protein [Polynucleobacter]ANI99922.1 hypothetical protein A8O14_07480 [Polynucleobacter wuianus]MBU3552749.1 hypothetical protein [Polynucleobacter sp. MWH-Post4-6-1]
MLDEKKSAIEAEERYRHEVASKLRYEVGAMEREVIAIEQGIWSKIQEFLNSNVGMWLLSSVLVTGGAGLYQTMQHHYEEKLHNKTQLITLQFEIANRIENMRYFWRKAKTIREGEFALRSVFQSKTPINPDVEKINLSVLYFNLYQLIGRQNQEVLEIVRKLEDMEYELQAQKPGDLLPEDEKKKGLELIGRLEQALIKQN